MTQFPANPHRSEPYKTFKFQVILDGRPIPGVSMVSGLKRVTEPVAFRDGGDPNHLRNGPGISSFAPIVLERGLTHDPTFRDWAELAFSPRGDAAMSLKNFRKDLRINLLNAQGIVVISFMVYRAWVSEFQALPELDAQANETAVETLVLEHEGWEQDLAVKEPVET